MGALNGVELAKGCLVTPRLKVVPIGWSWVRWWCQRLHERIMVRGGVVDEDCVVDRRVVPPLSKGQTLHTAYVDNFLAFGTHAEGVQRKVVKVMEALGGAGLVVEHEDPIQGIRA